MRSIVMLGIVLLLGVSSAAHAQKMYRCGNLFQGRPCEGPKAEKPDAAPAKPAGPSKQALAKRKRIRCENFERQVSELERRENGEKIVAMRQRWVDQRKALESKMQADSC